MQLWHLFVAFFRVGILGYGGGPSSIPLVQIEAVKNFHWMTVEEFADTLGIANALPGPIATKMAASIGYKVGGWPGVLAAEVGVVAPSLLAMVLLFALFDRFKDLPQVRGMISAIKPVVIVLLLLIIVDMWPKSMAGLLHWGIAVAAFVLAYVVKVHPALIVVGALAFGAVFLK